MEKQLGGKYKAPPVRAANSRVKLRGLKTDSAWSQLSECAWEHSVHALKL